MTTATPTRTLADVYRERLEQADPSDKLYSAIGDAISSMAPYSGETQDLRPSEVAWLDALAGAAVAAAREAAIAAIVDVYSRRLLQLMPERPGEGLGPRDPSAPIDLWAQGGESLTADADLVWDAEPER
ncbi:hypothetical protein BH23CHL10_BH23CHL10_13570 [soil metagenome]